MKFILIVDYVGQIGLFYAGIFLCFEAKNNQTSTFSPKNKKIKNNCFSQLNFIVIMIKSLQKYILQYHDTPIIMLNNPDKKSLLIHKNHLQKIYRIKTKHREQDEHTQLLQTNGIVSPTKLMLIICLIILSVSGLFRANNTHYPHVKALTNYFSYYVLEQTQLGIYDRGDNVDETYIEITTFQDMEEHFLNLVNFVENYTENGFANFTQNKPKNVDMQYYYYNGTVKKQYVNFQTFREMVLNSDLRKLLLELRVLYFQIQFGYNEIIDEFKLVFDYEVYSYSMLRLDMSTKYTAKVYEGMLRQEFILRNLERILAVVLMILYSIQARKLYYSTQLSKQFRKNSLYWCISLITLNFISIISTTFSSTCAVIQLLPIFQNHDSSNQSAYNFNVNLRYALPIVFQIITPVYMILSGFILYSMLMYPGEYFDDYATGFFSYFYNNFQYGIYEIFIQIRSRGNVAYLLYVILYFYMVLVGSNLIPAFFCTLILQKMAEQDLVRYVESQLEFIVCPKCKQECYQRDNYGLQININSPKSPYLRSGTKLKHSHDKSQKIARMYIEDQEGQFKSPSLSPIVNIKSKHKKARELSMELQELVDESIDIATQDWLKTQIDKLQKQIEQY